MNLRSRLAKLEERSGTSLAFFEILAPEDGETPEAFRTRVAETEQAAETFKRENPRTRGAFVMVFEDEENAA